MTTARCIVLTPQSGAKSNHWLQIGSKTFSAEKISDGQARMRHARPREAVQHLVATLKATSSASRAEVSALCPPGGEVGHGACAPVGAWSFASALTAKTVSERLA